MQDIWPQLKEWFSRRERFAIATVVGASKPSPRGVGATLAIHEDGLRFVGSVSAGCVENEVMEAAKASLLDGSPRWLEFGPGEGFPWEVSLSCGGKITVRIDPAPHCRAGGEAVSEALRAAMDRNEVGLMLSGDDGHLFLDQSGVAHGDLRAFPESVVSEARRRSEEGTAVGEFEAEGQRVLYRMIGYRARLFIVGASHIAINLASVAKMLQYEVVVIEPRGAYGRRDRFLHEPDELIVEWPEKALSMYQLTNDDALVAITHDPKIDDQALSVALASECGYIGALGSRKSHAARCRRLGRLGFDGESLSRIHGPVGLPIGSKTPAEIAISIVAELIKFRHEGERTRHGGCTVEHKE